MNGTASRTPPAMLHNLEHNKVLHDRVVFVTAKTRQVPHVDEEDRLEVENLGEGLYRVKMYYGFMDQPNIPAALWASAGRGLPPLDPSDTTYFLGRETIISSARDGMASWRERLFALMSRNARRQRRTWEFRRIASSNWGSSWRFKCRSLSVPI